jgi:putative sigma-54 modulation protein
MKVNITFRHLEATDSLKQYALEKVERVNKYFEEPGDAHIVLSVDRHVHHADITIHAGQFVLRGKENSNDMYASLDLAMDKIERQLCRYKEKLKRHHGKAWVHHRQDLVNHRFRHNVLEMTEPEKRSEEMGPRVIRSNEFLAQPMSVDEAVMRVDLMNNEFLVFTNATSGEVNVVYRRKDGHYGLIEATSSKSETAEQRRLA